MLIVFAIAIVVIALWASFKKETTVVNHDTCDGSLILLLIAVVAGFWMVKK